MTKIFRNLLWLALFTPIVALADVELTRLQPIVRMLYDGDIATAYFTGAGGWAASSCPTAVYVQVKITMNNRKEVFVSALAAHAAGRTVRFRGNCSTTNANYFDAYYIEVE